jgi:hypothetical protein
VLKFVPVPLSLKTLTSAFSRETLSAQKIGLKSLNDPVDTTHAQGRLIFNLFASLAEFKRDLIRERTNAGVPYTVICDIEAWKLGLIKKRLQIL